MFSLPLLAQNMLPIHLKRFLLTVVPNAGLRLISTTVLLNKIFKILPRQFILRKPPQMNVILKKNVVVA